MLYLILYTCRWTLESIGSLDPRKSALEDDFEEEEEKEEEEEHNAELENATHEKVLLLLFYEFFWYSVYPKGFIFGCSLLWGVGIIFCWYNRITTAGEVPQGKEIGTVNVTVTDIGKSMLFPYFLFLQLWVNPLLLFPFLLGH